MTSTVALIVAAGRGYRVGGEIPKQYLKLGATSVLHKTVSVFLNHPRVDAVRVVIHSDDRALYDEAIGGLELLEPVHGGATRQDSVRFGLESFAEMAPEKVLIHDAARPYVDDDLICRVIEAIDRSSGAVPALAVNDTLKRGRDGVILDTVDRTTLWRAQTPQGFKYKDILSAHGDCTGQELTDDAAVAEAGGFEVVMVDGNEMNIKITTPQDIEKAREAETGVEYRSGFGFDVHRFKAGDHVTLCGVKVAHDQALEGHSDADVGLHALTDALLGAIGAGDIGQHFPPTDEQWRGVTSDRFLEHAGKIVSERNGSIANVDVTLICEVPKVGPHRQTMETRIASILGITEDRVNVKATTTEKLGFTGRGEGIAAQAVASIRIRASY